jgi:6-methylsalicylate decarboxylase
VNNQPKNAMKRHVTPFASVTGSAPDNAFTNPLAGACDCGFSDRRSFLAGMGALGVAAVLPSCATSGGSAPRRFIDTHHHFFPEPYARNWVEWQKRNNVPVSLQPGWSPARALELMDQAGVAISLLSLASTPGTWFDLPRGEAEKMARLCNDFGAGMVRDHPRRFGLLATLPMLDVDVTLRELEYAFDTLKADGVGLQTSYGTRYPGDPMYRPVFEELNRRKALVYFHPLSPVCCVPPGLPSSAGMIETPTDTTRAVMSLLTTGTFSRYRDIRWLFSHGGGSLPALAGRIRAFIERGKEFLKFVPDGVEAELARLHYDTANATHPTIIAALLKLAPVSQITYGSDYPYFPMREQIESFGRLELNSAQMHAIERGNAERLVPRLATL